MGKLRLRETYIRDAQTLLRSGSASYPINIVDPIMDIYFKFHAQNETVSNIRNYLFDVVNEIEVIDGSDVLFSLKPREILAMNAYHYKESMHWGITEDPSAWQECVFKIPFGIGRYDPTIAFDPTKFKNPQIRFSWDLDNITKTATHGFVTAGFTVDVIATVAERYPARPAGFLMHKHIHEYLTQGGLNVHRVEMPVDYPHRTVFMAAKENTRCPWETLKKAKYNVDQEKYIPFNWWTDDWMMWLKEFYGLWHQGEEFMPFSQSTGATSYRHLFLPGNRSFAIVDKQAADDTWWSQCTACYNKVYFSATTGTATHMIQVKADGSLPFSTWAYPFGDPTDMEEWLQVRDIGKIYFEITDDVADQHARVFLTQYRNY